MGTDGEHQRPEAETASTSEDLDLFDREHRNLLATLQHLHDVHEISAGLQSMFDLGFTLWVSDHPNGHYARRQFAWTELTNARMWLVDTVQELKAELRLIDDLPDRPLEAARSARMARHAKQPAAPSNGQS